MGGIKVKEVNTTGKVNQSKGLTVYCHFSFKRPKGEEYGLFAVAIYRDFEGKKLITSKTRKFKLWENHQFISAIQAYEHALLSIYEWQGMMTEAGIRQVMLVTDNSTLAGWIENPNKNKNYAPYMQRAVKMFKVGAPKEIVIGIGLCEPRNSEKSYKYCKEELVCNEVPQVDKTDRSKGYKIDISKVEGVQLASDLVENDIAVPKIVGMTEVDV
jgi:hypothetical protein